MTWRTFCHQNNMLMMYNKYSYFFRPNPLLQTAPLLISHLLHSSTQLRDFSSLTILFTPVASLSVFSLLSASVFLLSLPSTDPSLKHFCIVHIMSALLCCCYCLPTPPCLLGGVIPYFEVTGYQVPVSSLEFKCLDCFIWKCSYIVYPSKMKGPFRVSA